MADPLSKGLPFQVADLWRTSTFTSELETRDGIFEIADLDLASLLQNGKTTDLIDLGKNIQELDQIRDLDGAVSSADDRVFRDETTTTNDEASKVDTTENEQQPDIWDFSADGFARNGLPVFRTWEAFEGKDVHGMEKTAYLSEAGPAAFNAMLASQDHGNAKNGFLPQDVSLRAFQNLVLGRSSIFFQWNATRRLFEATLPDIPMAGLSPECSESVTQFFVNHGSDIRRLYEDSAAPVSTGMALPTATALNRCIESVLDDMEIVLSGPLKSAHSILQLQDHLTRSRELLDVLLKLSHAIWASMSDEQAIEILSNEIAAIVVAGSPFTPLLHVILARASQPWLDALLMDIGLAGASPGPAAEGSAESSGRDVGLDTSLDSSAHSQPRTLTFITREDSRLISETKATLRLLRLHFPEYVPDPSPGPLHGSTSKSKSAGAQALTEQRSEAPDMHTSISDVWAMDETTLDSEMHINSDFMGEDRYSYQNLEVRRALVGAFDAGENITSNRLGSGLLEALSLSPLEPLRLSIEKQASKVSRIFLRHLFKRCQLREHLALQRSFHLCGNGDFVLRLCTALFSSDTQPAERTRGRTPTSQTVGLRLGTREGQHWPPASSELQLSLKDVLSDVYSGHTSGSQSLARFNELPGGLSFTIRELPDTEIDRVMDASSIYALDFLKLQYTAPPPLDAVITSTSLRRYDDIFRFLLKLVRLQDVTTRIRPSLHDSAKRSPILVGPRHFIATLTSHFMEVGIGSCWRTFETTLAELEDATFSETEPSQVIMRGGLHHLRSAHEECLDSIRDRLFLKRKQEQIRFGIEDVFQAIMKLATCFQADQAAHEEEQRFKAAIKRLVTMLEDHVNRPLRGRSSAGSSLGSDDVDTTALLLSRLNWNQFYSAEVKT